MAASRPAIDSSNQPSRRIRLSKAQVVPQAGMPGDRDREPVMHHPFAVHQVHSGGIAW